MAAKTRFAALLFGLAALALACCGPADVPSKSAQAKVTPPVGWKLIRTPANFSFYAPPELQRSVLGGSPIDSTMGAFSTGKSRLVYDFGRYSNDLADFKTDHRYLIEPVTVSGRSGIVVTGPGRGEETWGCDGKLTALYVREDADAALEMHGCADDETGIQTLRTILSTVEFMF